MKISNLSLAAAAFAFACFSYHQIAGINFLLFSVLLQLLFTLHNKQIWQRKNYKYASVLSTACACNVILSNSDLSIAAFVISHFLLPAVAFNRKHSAILNFVYSLYSLIAAIPLSLTRIGEHKPKEEQTIGNPKTTLAIAALLSLTLGFVFFLLYRSASPLFKSATDAIDLSWLSFSWLFLAVLGFILYKGLTANETFEAITTKDAEALSPLFNKELGTEQDRTIYTVTGIALFSLLNVFQLLVNGLDLHYLYIAKTLPQGVSLSDFVHQAVGGMLALITIALLVISFLFGGWFNFDPKNKWVRQLSLIWIVQAQVMLLNTAMRNWWYVQSYQLTYLRLLVVVTLIVCSIALYFIWQKIQHKQSNWFFFNAVFKALLVLFFSASFVNWDNVIARYNIAQCKDLKNLDVRYLCSLPGVDSELLLPLVTNTTIAPEHKQDIRYKLFDRHLQDRFQQWPSWNYRSYKNEGTYFSLYK